MLGEGKRIYDLVLLIVFQEAMAIIVIIILISEGLSLIALVGCPYWFIFR
jgi:hypothetical protein